MSPKNELILYSYFRSSASYRVRLALALKDLEYRYEPIHLLKDGGQQRSSNYAKLNPMQHVPTLVHGDFVLGESMAILKYLDHVKDVPRLFPEDPKEEATVIQICEMMNSGIQPLQNLKVLQHLETMGVDQEARKEWTAKWIRSGLKALDQLLESTSKTHCFGNDWTAADCLLIPQIFSSLRFGVNPAEFKTIHRIYTHLENHPAVQKAHPANQPDSE